MLKQLFSLYSPSYPKTLVYMLQATEYQVKPYLAWVWRTKDFNSVMRRRSLDLTRPARLLLIALRLGILLQLALGCLLIYLGAAHNLAGGVPFGTALIIAYPLVWPYLLIMPLVAGRWFINGPAASAAIAESAEIFAAHPGVKLAIAGSYGKTTMKDLLQTVLSQGFNVAATPGNKNVSVSHAKFAKGLSGKEDILIIEYGEGGPGDIERFARITKPTDGIITGLAPAHLDKYKTLEAAGQDIFSLAEFVSKLYVNDEPKAIKPFIKSDYQLFNRNGALGWQTANIKTSLEGTSFTLKKGQRQLKLSSGLVGEHQVAYLAFVAAVALRLGLSEARMVTGINQTKPFEHRLQPYRLNDAWVIDDTYNGNLEGIRAGLELLKKLSAKRKIYVTPGLVDQGKASEAVHREIGNLIAASQPEVVVLMQNSVTKYIKQGLKEAKYKGDLRVESDPLEFYSNLNHFVASGDVVLMQNDWTDNYA